MTKLPLYLYFWSGCDLSLSGIFLKFLHVADKSGSQLLVFLPVLFFITPGTRRIEHIFGNIRAGLGEFEAEHGIGMIFHLRQRIIQNRIQQVPRVSDAGPLAYSIRPPNPPGIDQPAPDLVTFNLTAQQFAI